ncbi:phospholipid scramblase 1 [Zeugodacus cucurbitae]|uniref:phospholipid scramblase 1 n=1 Tax=Zeugodacus cucurbitae TaxID=28588 RepID=UPI0005969E07|nr:phospholipid scramblase 1 [Zeugodacus cucurbitae]
MSYLSNSGYASRYGVRYATRTNIVNTSLAAVHQSSAPRAQYNGGGPGPIVQQPGMPESDVFSGDWMSIPACISHCLRGLEYLMMVDQLLVEQKVEFLEALTGFEGNNKFVIKNSLGQNIYYAVEDTDWCTRNTSGSNRPFDMKVFDNSRNEIIHMYRSLSCSVCCFTCVPETMEVSTSAGNVIGIIEEEPTFGSTLLHVKNYFGENVLRIEGIAPEFNVVSLTGETVGKISKQWSGLAREIFTDADFFGITFPMDLDVRMKAVLLGATFLIDAMYYENN